MTAPAETPVTCPPSEVHDTIVTWTLTPVGDGTRVRMVHSGFELPKNERAFSTMSQGWKKVVPTMAQLAGDADS